MNRRTEHITCIYPTMPPANGLFEVFCTNITFHCRMCACAALGCPLPHNAPTLGCDEALLIALTTVSRSSIILIPRYRISLLTFRSAHCKSHEGIIVFGITNFLKLKTVPPVI